MKYSGISYMIIVMIMVMFLYNFLLFEHADLLICLSTTYSPYMMNDHRHHFSLFILR